MKHRFDELGIEIPFPHQTLYFGEDKAGAAPPMHLRVDDEAATPVKATARRGKSLRVVKTNDPKSPIDDHD
jgi:small conductance mechanosensitive channel